MKTKRKLIVMGVMLAATAACGDERTGGTVEDDGAVPEGAIPAADDYRPDVPEAGAAAGAAATGTAADTAVTAASDTLTTGPGAAGRIQPR